MAFILFSHKEHGNQFFPISVIAWNPSFFKAAGGLIYWMVFGILLTYKHFKNTLHFFSSFPSTIFKMKPTHSASQEKKDGHAFLLCESAKPIFFSQSLKHKLKFALVSAILLTNCPMSMSQGRSLFSCRHLWLRIIQFSSSRTLESTPYREVATVMICFVALKMMVLEVTQPAPVLVPKRLRAIISKMLAVGLLRMIQSLGRG